MRRVLGLAASVLLLAGCLTSATKGTGGGWIASVVPGEQAHFSFAVSCERATPREEGEPCVQDTTVPSTVSGRFEDKGTGLKIRLQTVSVIGAPGAQCQTGTFTYTSEVRSRSVDDTGTGTVTVCEGKADRAGNPGRAPQDQAPATLSVQILSGPFMGYTNSGPLLGGSINIRYP